MLKIKSPSVEMKHKKRSTLPSLPQDMLVEVVMQVASKSPAPIENIRSLRATCKRFHKATMDKLVGRSIAVGKETKMLWYEKDAYLALLRRCAECANLEANFILGFRLFNLVLEATTHLLPLVSPYLTRAKWEEEIYNLGMKAQGLEHLRKAMDGGHLTAAYLLGIMLFLDIETQFDGVKILNKISSGNLSSDCTEVTECTRTGNPLVDRCRRATTEIARRSWKEWQMQQRLMPCRDQLCGRIVKMKDVNFWVEKDRLPRAYCSQTCRWTAECNMFLGK